MLDLGKGRKLAAKKHKNVEMEENPDENETGNKKWHHPKQNSYVHGNCCEPQ